jgi:RecA/RadA recombinase
MNLLEKIKKNSTIKETSVLSNSKFFTDRDLITTKIPVLNIALSGKVDGGFSSGLTMWAGVSKMFKTGFSLMMAKAFMDKYPESVLLFYDSEFGSPQSYFKSFDIDLNRVIHTPITDVEQLKFDIMQQLNQIERSDKIIILIDSIGNLASKKEVEDALDSKSTVDMSRAKNLKSLFRMITPHLAIKDIPMVVINHTYKTMELYAKDVVGGGTGSVYAADNIYILGRQQEKEGTELSGYNFIINVEKSRFVREKSKIPINISFDNGVSKYSGLIDIALELGFVTKPSMGWYARVNRETGEVEEKKYRIKDTSNKEFWDPILNSQAFKDAVYNRYAISSGSIMVDEDIEKEFAKIEEVEVENE